MQPELRSTTAVARRSGGGLGGVPQRRDAFKRRQQYVVELVRTRPRASGGASSEARESRSVDRFSMVCVCHNVAVCVARWG